VLGITLQTFIITIRHRLKTLTTAHTRIMLLSSDDSYRKPDASPSPHSTCSGSDEGIPGPEFVVSFRTPFCLHVAATWPSQAAACERAGALIVRRLGPSARIKAGFMDTAQNASKRCRPRLGERVERNRCLTNSLTTLSAA
jgi:hypothetical protein